MTVALRPRPDPDAGFVDADEVDWDELVARKEREKAEIAADQAARQG